MPIKSLVIVVIIVCIISLPHSLSADSVFEYPSIIYLSNNYQGLTKFRGVESGDLTGVTIASGDVNGDGLIDIIVGATGAKSVINRPESGVVYILYGRNGFFSSMDMDPINHAGDMTVVLGLNAYDELGFRIICGDVDGDDIDDIIIGATGRSYSDEAFREKAFIIKGTNAISDKRYIDLYAPQVPVVAICSETDNTQFGFTCSSGDYNDDGCDDVMIGAPSAWSHLNEQRSGRSYFISGSPSFFNRSEINVESECQDIVVIDGMNHGDAFGIGAASGDFNGDGFEDIAIGAWTADRQVYPFATNAGKVYVFWGASAFFQVEDYSVETDPGSYAVILGEQGMLGHNLSAGDLDSDGISDIIAGAHTYCVNDMYAMREEAGALYCIWGDTSYGDGCVIDLAVLSESYNCIIGANNGDHSAIGMVADANNDGYVDLVVGSPEAYFNFARYGVVYVIFGPINHNSSVLDLATSHHPFSRIVSEYRNSGFCRNNMVSGDIDGDGMVDMVFPCLLGAETGVIYAISGDQSCYTEPTNPILAVGDMPKNDFTLVQNYPNPFNPVTTIQFVLPEKTHVSLKVYNILGVCVAELLDDVMESGSHNITWDAGNNAAGAYLYCLQAGYSKIVNRMILTK